MTGDSEVTINGSERDLCELMVITNARGLHARAAAKFSQLAATFRADVYVVMGEARVDARSIMGLMMLAASRGTELKICASGPDAPRAMAAVSDLIKRGFDEE